jgi:hypothetical protein
LSKLFDTPTGHNGLLNQPMEKRRFLRALAGSRQHIAVNKPLIRRR